MDVPAKRSYSGVDQAVLAGTALIVVLTDNEGPGTYSPFDMLTGIVLLMIVVGFYRPPTTGDRRTDNLYIAVTASVAALTIGLIAAWPAQHLLDHYDPPTIFYLHCANETGHYRPDCVAQATSSYLVPAIWLLLAPVLYGTALLHQRRLARQNRRNTAVPANDPLPIPAPAESN